jgi:hypothetical protein
MHGLVALLIMRPNFGWAPVERLGPAMLDAILNGLVKA